ncbi:MAG: hypothetical protein HZB79_01200 [Deltaproteobacteria bacterium]|nr:hypothetical protein [Deltaproteobacteria bacterium]
MKLFDWIKNRFDAQIGRVALLYLCGVLLYAILGFFFISKFSGTDITKGGKAFIVEGKVRPYWGLIFGPIFFAFTIPSILRFLKGFNKRDGIEIMLMLWLAYDVIAFIVGAINGNSLRYLFGDTFLLSIIPLSYFFVRNYIKEDRGIRSLFYFMLFFQIILFSFPIHGFAIMIYKEISPMGFYTLPFTETFIIVSLMILATLSKNRWIYMALLIGILPAVFSRSLRLTSFLQIFTAMALVFSIRITEKGFVKRFAAVLLVVFISISLFWRFDLIEEKAVYLHFHPVYSKMLQAYTSVYNKINDNIIKEEKAKGIESPEVKVVQEEKAKGIESPEVKVVSVRKIVEVIGEGRYEIEPTIKKIGQSSLKFIKVNSDASKQFYARIRISDDYDKFYFDGRKITFGCWVFSPTDKKIMLRISDIDTNLDSDGPIYANSTVYSGNGKWEFLTVSKEIRSKIDVVELWLFVLEYKDGVYYADGGIVVEGEIDGHKLSAMVNPDNDLFENFEVYAYPAMNQSINHRIYEARVVMEKIKSNLLTFLFGYGNGAVIDLSRSPDPTIASVYGNRVKAVHAIHLLPFALLYRNGAIGLAIFFVFCIVLIACFIRMIKYFKMQGDGAIIIEVLFLNVFIMILAGIFAASNLFISITTGFCLGLIGAARHNMSSSETTVK